MNFFETLKTVVLTESAPAPLSEKIEIDPAHKGMLHKHLGIPEGEPIPEDKLEDALHSDDAHVRKMAQFAKNAKKWHHESEEHYADDMIVEGACGYRVKVEMKDPHANAPEARNTIHVRHIMTTGQNTGEAVKKAHDYFTGLNYQVVGTPTVAEGPKALKESTLSDYSQNCFPASNDPNDLVGKQAAKRLMVVDINEPTTQQKQEILDTSKIVKQAKGEYNDNINPEDVAPAAVVNAKKIVVDPDVDGDDDEDDQPLVVFNWAEALAVKPAAPVVNESGVPKDWKMKIVGSEISYFVEGRPATKDEVAAIVSDITPMAVSGNNTAAIEDIEGQPAATTEVREAAVVAKKPLVTEGQIGITMQLLETAVRETQIAYRNYARGAQVGSPYIQNLRDDYRSKFHTEGEIRLELQRLEEAKKSQDEEDDSDDKKSDDEDSDGKDDKKTFPFQKKKDKKAGPKSDEPSPNQKSGRDDDDDDDDDKKDVPKDQDKNDNGLDDDAQDKDKDTDNDKDKDGKSDIEVNPILKL